MSVLRFFILIVFLLFYSGMYAQDVWWVYLTDKGDTSQVQLSSFFSAHSIQRRELMHIDFDYSDYPVCANYLQQVSFYVDSMGYSSRWLNAVKVYADAKQIEELKTLPFVMQIEKINDEGYTAICTTSGRKVPLLKALSEHQLNRIGLPFLQQQNYTGKGVRICVIDAGFLGVPQSSGFAHLFQNNRIEKTWDFIKKDNHVYRGATHGTMVLSCLAGMNDTLQTGLATGATYLLARTESVFSENRKEEDRWIAALEWADMHGANIVNSSLGYASPRFERHELNGQSRLSRVASMAADKGMLLVNAAGNEYNGMWKSLIIPADADNILTVGAVEPETDFQTSYSSVGPTADGRLKPNVCAPGWVTVFGRSSLYAAEGTSFAAPLVAGLAACVWQALGDTLRPIDIINRIEQASHLYPYFDYAHGYGVPHAARFFALPRPFPCFKTELVADDLLIFPDSLFVHSADVNPLLYFHVQSQSGILRTYGLIEIENSHLVNFTLSRDLSLIKKSNSYHLFVQSGDIIRLHMSGYTAEITIP